MNIALLDRLREAREGHVAWPLLHVEFPECEPDLDVLEAFGYVLERHPYLGVGYRGPARRLSPDQIEWTLNTRWIGRRVAVWNRVTSTNDLAARAAGSRANAGLVILAEEQTHGRGRQGRVWTAPRGTSLLMSVLIFPPPELYAPGWLTALGAVAVAELVESTTGHAARIKWPNDVRIDGRKVAGILVERNAGSVIGIGLNVNIPADLLPESLQAATVSLQRLAGHELDRSDLARSLIQRLDALYDLGLTQGAASLDLRWQERLEARGARVRVETTAGTIQGVLTGASLLDGLTLDTEQGCRQVPGGDVLSLAPECAILARRAPEIRDESGGLRAPSPD